MQTSSIDSFGYRQQLRRSLGLFDLLVYGLVLISPTAPFSGFGIVFNASAAMVPLVYLIGLIAISFTALSYIEMSRVFPLAGSVYSYARNSFGENVGFLAGWMMVLDYLLVPALIYIGCAVAIDAVLPGVPLSIWAIVLLITNTVINLRGTESMARANIALLVVQLIVLLLFIVLGCLAVSRGVAGAHLSARPFFDAGRISPHLIFGAMALGVLNYLGFDAISTLSEEARGGARAVGRATLFSLLIVAVLFIGQSYLASLFVLDRASFPPGTPTYGAFYRIAAVIGGPWLKVATSIVCALPAGMAAALSAQAAISRLLFSMARDRKLPSLLSQVSAKRQVPAHAIVLVAAVTIGLILLFENKLTLLVTIVSFGALVGFLVLHASVVMHYMWRNRSRRWVRHLLVPASGFAVTLSIIVNIDVKAKLVGTCWLAVGGIIALLLKFTGQPLRVGLPVGQSKT